jgi:hypothetical protein
VEKTRHDSAVIVFDFDPGGQEKKFGCACLDINVGGFEAYSACSVDDALDWTKKTLKVPVAAGIDTLLFWQSTKAGWRGADHFLRKRYPQCQSSIMAANSMYGSMSVQGAVLATRLEANWNNLLLTETHPKVLWAHLQFEYPTGHNWKNGHPEPVQRWLKEETLNGDIKSEHEFDALLSAWAAKNAYTKEWHHDLSNESADDQQHENVSPLKNFHYFWPS